jgi:hydrophobic/amphiphilic exporter-1 (mainly G- bacteria), HAE1 family
VVVTIAIAASALVSLTLTPMLAARLSASAAHGLAKKNLFERGFDRVHAGYRVLLDLCLRFRFTTFLVFLGTVGLTVYMFSVIPKGFFPTEDIGQLTVSTEARQDISFEAMATLQKQVETVLRKSPHVTHVVSSVGASGFSGAMNQGRFFVELKPKNERASLDQVISDLRRQLAQVPGISSFVNPVQNLRLGGRTSKSQYQFVVQALNRGELETLRTGSPTP